MSHYFKTYSDPVNATPYLIAPRQIKLIGIIGDANSGKDTFATIAASQHKFFRLAFAYPMKQFMRNSFGLSKYAVHNPYGKQQHNDYWGMTNRRSLQLFGSEAMQPVFGKTVWCKCLHIDMHEYIQECQVDRFSISDVRMPHELEYILREMEGTIVHIKRPQVNILKANERAHSTESTEATMKLVNDFVNNPKVFTIANTGTLEEFKASCYDVVNQIVNPNSGSLSTRDTLMAGCAAEQHATDVRRSINRFGDKI